jgi:hypothetical protein
MDMMAQARRSGQCSHDPGRATTAGLDQITEGRMGAQQPVWDYGGQEALEDAAVRHRRT